MDHTAQCYALISALQQPPTQHRPSCVWPVGRALPPQVGQEGDAPAAGRLLGSQGCQLLVLQPEGKPDLQQ